jgi:hypothetical protein
LTPPSRATAVALAGALIVVTGCESVIGADFAPVETVECKHAGPPPRPAEQNGGGSEEVVVGITGVDVGDRDLPDGSRAYRHIGFDLDHACSFRGDRPTCHAFDWAKPDVIDGADGIDNGGGGLMYAEKSLFGIAPFASDVVTEGIKKGTVAPLAILRLRGYNLRVVDDSVELDWYIAQPRGAAGGIVTPRLDGTDEWPIWEGSVEPGSVPPPSGQPYPPSRFRDGSAYVADYTLVAKLPQGTPLKLQNVSFTTEGLTVMLKLAYDPFRVVGGTIAGYVRAVELFRKMPQMTQEFKLGTICKTDVSYPRIKTYFCGFIESHADGRNEPDAPCDAISIGMELQTTIVKHGPIAADSSYASCAPEADPSTDSCANPAEQK